MFDFYDSNYSDEFKQRLQDARCKKKFSQQDFADCLEDNDRSRVANWESKKSTTVPKTFSTSAIQKLEKAFHRFSCEVFSIDRNEHTFVPYVKKVFPWNRKKQSIEDFVQSIVINEKYYEMLETNPLYQEQTSDERYETLIYDFSKASIQYLERNQLAELAKYNVANIFSEIVQDYVDVTVNNFKNREK